MLSQYRIDNTHSNSHKKELSLFGLSKCVHCETRIPFYYNIPILGWLILRGRTSCCGKSYSSQYMWVELAFGLLGVLMFYAYGLGYALYASASVMLLIVIFFIHGRHGFMPIRLLFLLFATGNLYFALQGKDSYIGYCLNMTLSYLAITTIQMFSRQLLDKDIFDNGTVLLIAIICGGSGFAYFAILLTMSLPYNLFYFLHKFESTSKDKIHDLNRLNYAGSAICLISIFFISLDISENILFETLK